VGVTDAVTVIVGVEVVVSVALAVGVAVTINAGVAVAVAGRFAAAVAVRLGVGVGVLVGVAGGPDVVPRLGKSTITSRPVPTGASAESKEAVRLSTIPYRAGTPVELN